MDDTCTRCNGRGVAAVNIQSVGFGAGFAAFMAPAKVYPSDAPPHHELVCPRCNGTGTVRPITPPAGTQGRG